ncbi:MAG: hypothetical protein SFY81_04940 [Verrucomicrobiota bacterium]|nr:hypothetical protein [Verrucomicrobiota bacterium]
MSVPIELQQADAVLGQRFAEIISFQNSKRAATGKYVHFTESHSTVPSGPVAPDKIEEPSPISQLAWADAGEMPSTMRTQLIMYPYGNDGAEGWILEMRAMVGNDLWIKTVVGAGPETTRAHQWRNLGNPSRPEPTPEQMSQWTIKAPN